MDSSLNDCFMDVHYLINQTGSGKTYTIWGASNTLLEDDQQGLAPRVFRRLFERINEVSFQLFFCNKFVKP